MPASWTDNQKRFGEYLVASVETDLDYGGTYLVDAITIGITQWWAYHACRLLEKLKAELPDNYELLTERVKDAVAAHPSTDTSFWEGFFLTREDANAWKTAAADKQNHAVQDALWDTDAYGGGGYTDTLASWGVDVSNVKSTLFYLTIYHQSPRSCLQIIRNIGGNRTISEIRAAALNHSVVGKYTSRQNEVYNLLANWDGTSAPPDFGQASNPNTDPGGDTSTDGQASATVSYVEIRGDILYIHGGETGVLPCYPNGGGYWIPQRNNSAPSYPSTTPGGEGGGTSDDFAAMKALWESHNREWSYSQGGGRLNPPQSGYSDCSACIWWAANAATDNKYKWLGTSTYTMLTTAKSIFRNTTGELDTSKMLPGDLIVMAWNSGTQHVDWYWGDGEVWGAGSSPLPKQITKSSAATYLKGRVKWVNVMRFID